MADEVQLDSTPTGAEEELAFPNPAEAQGRIPYDTERAKRRIDAIATCLAVVWTMFLMFIILAQGHRTGMSVWGIPVLPKFKMETAEFIAVVTTTTASVFGFLLIVANFVFKKKD